MEYTFLKTASATAKKNNLQLCKNKNRQNYLLDLSLLTDIGSIPEKIKLYIQEETMKDILSDLKFSYVFCEVSASEYVTVNLLYKIFIVDTEEKNNIYKICKLVGIDYSYYVVDEWTGKKKIIKEFKTGMSETSCRSERVLIKEGENNDKTKNDT